MKTNGLVLLLSIIFLLTSCEEDDKIENVDNYSIKSIVSYGKISSKYIYNNFGKITEKQSFNFCNKYLYDNNGHLIKHEIAADPEMYSSVYHERNELMTSQNSIISGYRIFEYNQDERVEKVKNYFKKDGVFVYTSMNSFEYDGYLIVRSNLHNEDYTITQFNTYEYDKNGNVERKICSSCLFTENSESRIISETSYKYDNKKNPFKIFNALGYPGLYTNTNNVIETNSILYEDTLGIDKYSTIKTSYEYNWKNYPVKEISENSEHEYKYE